VSVYGKRYDTSMNWILVGEFWGAKSCKVSCTQATLQVISYKVKIA